MVAAMLLLARHVPAIAAFFLALPAAAPAALGGELSGVVTRAGGAPAPDVVVTATAPRSAGEQVAVTDAAGRYRLPGLPAGSYRLAFEHGGERLERDVIVAGGGPARVDVALGGAAPAAAPR